MGRPPELPQALPSPHRVLIRWVNAFLPGGVLVVSLYLPATDPFGPESTLLLSRLGEALHSAGLAFLIGGDWNAPPALLGRLVWPSRLGGRIISPSLPT
eukprot:8640166-Pyramimonas_sp.AAC.1